MTSTPRANRLQHEKSPYLLQHAFNPVEWYPWGEEAFAAARAAGKPVFLSIGYSTCYWCHVMEKESFESESIAALLNESFISIKVDREERPDIDALYMAAVQAMTGQGGWPMSVFVTPDGEPFWCGTYFPPVDGHGRAGFATILRALATAWRDRRADVVGAGKQLAEAIQSAARPRTAPAPLPPDIVARAAKQLARSADHVHGGFGGAPKFPRPHALSLLLRHWERSRSAESLGIVESTLGAMARGGIHDQLGGGLHRYAVDERWMIPHFEKMLYDQALHARAAVEAYRATDRASYADMARDTIEYVLRDMRDPGGAFYSAEDAGEVGREGEFYVWRPEDLIAWLDERDVALAAARWGITASGNFEDGTTVLHEAQSIAEVAAAQGMRPDEARVRLDAIRARLLAARDKRERPHRDDKILTDWNGLMIGTLAFAGSRLEEPRYVDAAAAASQTILQRMRGSDGLLHRYRDGHAGIPAFLDDVACLSAGLLDVFDATGDPAWLRAAIDLADEMIASFADAENGGFHQTSPRHDRLIARVRDAYDGAVPSGQSMAALVCVRLAHLTMEQRFREQAGRSFASFAGTVTDMPSAFTAFLCAWDLWSGPVDEVVIAATSDAASTTAALAVARRGLHSRRVVVQRPTGPAAAGVEELVPFTRGRAPSEGRVTAYVCRDSVCSRPLVGLEDLAQELNGR